MSPQVAASLDAWSLRVIIATAYAWRYSLGIAVYQAAWTPDRGKTAVAFPLLTTAACFPAARALQSIAFLALAS
jgi:hypothetical protein